MSGRSVTIVTGASLGLGREIALALARASRDLVLVARNEALLESLADEIAAAGRPRPLVRPLDLAAPDACATLIASLADVGVDGLVNNAGYGLIGEAASLDLAGQLGMIDLNIRALTELTLRLAPQLVAARGRILNVASVAAFMPGPGMAVYYASKAFVLSFSEALHQELAGKGVGVTALCPGPVATSFWSRAGLAPAFVRLLGAAEPRPVAEAGVKAMLAGKRRATPGLLNAAMTHLAPATPRALLLPIVARLQAARGAARERPE